MCVGKPPSNLHHKLIKCTLHHFQKKPQLDFYLQTSIYYLQTPLKNYLTSGTPENSYLAATCLMMRFCVKATDQLPRSFILFDLLAERSFRREGGENSEKVGASTFHFHSTYLLCSLSLLTIELRKFFLPGEFPTTSKVSNLPSPRLPPPPGNGSDSINVRRRTYPPLFHASVNPGIFPCKEMKGSFEATGRQKRENTYFENPPVFIKTSEEKESFLRAVNDY